MMGNTVTAMADAKGISNISLPCCGLDTQGPTMPARFPEAGRLPASARRFGFGERFEPANTGLHETRRYASIVLRVRFGAVHAVVARGDLGNHTIGRHGVGRPRRDLDDGAGLTVVGLRIVTDIDVVGLPIHAIDDDVGSVVELVGKAFRDDAPDDRSRTPRHQDHR